MSFPVLHPSWQRAILSPSLSVAIFGSLALSHFLSQFRPAIANRTRSQYLSVTAQYFELSCNFNLDKHYRDIVCSSDTHVDGKKYLNVIYCVAVINVSVGTLP